MQKRRGTKDHCTPSLVNASRRFAASIQGIHVDLRAKRYLDRTGVQPACCIAGIAMSMAMPAPHLPSSGSATPHPSSRGFAQTSPSPSPLSEQTMFTATHPTLPDPTHLTAAHVIEAPLVSAPTLPPAMGVNFNPPAAAGAQELSPFSKVSCINTPCNFVCVLY